jgi:alpha-ribazole phosphatase
MGRTDGAPTAEGIAACLAQAAHLDFVHVVASDLQRARRPAEAIAAARNAPLTIDPRWRELDFGSWDGLAPASLDAQTLAAFWDDPEAHPPPGGERWSALAHRVAAAIEALPAGPVLVVAHGGAIRAALHALCGFARRQLWAFDLPYAARVTLQVWPGEAPNAQITALTP